MIERTCEHCGIGFLIQPCYLKRGSGSGRFCSHKCANQMSHHPRWIGGRINRPSGYVDIRMPDHPRSRNGYVFEHILVAEKALGRYLGTKHPVHHHDENRSNNANTNLVICEDLKYHKLIHARMRVLKAGGNPDSQRICAQCQSIFDFSGFYTAHSSYCTSCECAMKRDERITNSRKTSDGYVIITQEQLSARNHKAALTRWANKRANQSNTHCSAGHPLEGDNLILSKTGFKKCLECRRKYGPRLDACVRCTPETSRIMCVSSQLSDKRRGWLAG